MPAVYHSNEEFENYYNLWQLEHHSPTWPLYASDEAKLLVRNAAHNLEGQISISHFVLGFDKLVKDGTLRQLRQPRAEVKQFTLSADDYHKIPASEIVRRYRASPEFKEAVDLLIEQKLI
jgi:hypothetical protein